MIIISIAIINYVFWLTGNYCYQNRMYLSWKSICSLYHMNPGKWVWDDYNNCISQYDFYHKLFYNYKTTKTYHGNVYEYVVITTSLLGYYKLKYYYSRWKKNEKIKKKNDIKKEVIESMQDDINIELQKATKLINNANKQVEEIRKGMK